MSLIGADLAQKRWFKLLVLIVILASIVFLGLFLYLFLIDDSDGEISSSSKPLNATNEYSASKSIQSLFDEELDKNLTKNDSLAKNDSLIYKDNRPYSGDNNFWLIEEPKVEPYSVWKNSVDESANACNDFYAFTCGNYMPNRQDDFDENSADVKVLFSKVIQDLKTPIAKDKAMPEVEKCLKKAVFGNKPSNSIAVATMRRFWNSINNGLAGRTTKQMISQMELIGGCPAILGKNDFNKDFSLIDALFNLKKFTGTNALFTGYTHELENGSFVFGVKPDNHTMIKPSTYVDSNGVVLDKFIEVREELFSLLFKSTAKRVDGILGDFDEIAYELAYLDKQVFEIMAENEFQRRQELGENEMFGFEDSQLDPIPFEELNEVLSVINGTEYFIKIFEYYMPEMAQYLKSNPTIYLNNKELLISLNNFYATKDKETMANYLCVFYLIEQQKISRLNNDIEYQSVELSMLKKEFDEFKQEAAINTLQRLFGFVTDYLFIDECIDAKDLKLVARMVDEIQQSSLKMIEEQDWLDPLTKSRALQKLKSIKKIVGALDVAFNVTKLDKYYQRLNFTPQDNIHDIFAKVFLFIDSSFFRDVVTQKESIDIYRANEMNSINLIKDNAIVIYAGNLFSPSFDAKRPDSLNYGAIGMMIGHEIWHSLKKNSTFDENGLKKDLWTPKSYEKFKERAKCFVSKYDELEEIDSYGTKTLDENLADIHGLKAAYYAYKHHSIGQEQTKVPGYKKYSDIQAFFISYGTTWCVNHLNVTQRILADINDHALNHYRVNEPLKNMPEFAVAFNCPLGSKMNPRHKCEVF